MSYYACLKYADDLTRLILLFTTSFINFNSNVSPKFKCPVINNCKNVLLICLLTYILKYERFSKIT